jgi:predicted aspartyl protease
MTLRYPLLCLPLLAACAGPPHVDAPEACTVQRVAEVPLTLRDGFLTVPVTIEDKPVTMLIDTGAERTMVTPGTVSALRLDRDRHRRTQIIGTGGSTITENAKVQSFGFGGYEVSDQSYAVGALGPDQSEGGLVGADWLSLFDVEIDVPQQRIALYQEQGCNGRYIPWHGPYADIQHVRPQGRALIVLPVRVAGQPITAILDSGANTTQLTQTAAARLGVGEADLARDPASHTVGVDQANVAMHRHRFPDMVVGVDEFPSVLLSVGAVQVPGADMLLGADFLRSRRVWLSYATGQVFIQRSSPRG